MNLKLYEGYSNVCFDLNFSVSASSCKDPKITSKSYTTLDASVLTNIAYLAEFELTCGGKPATIPLYAEINGQVLNVVRGSKYQVSWTEEIAKATRGDHVLNLYDEEGFAQLRKVSVINALYHLCLRCQCI